MKFNKNNDHNHEISGSLFKHIPNKVRQYTSNMFHSLKCKKMSHGSRDIMRIITSAHGDNWRRNHCKSERKHHK